ncbi:hypothetical protein BM86_17480 [Bacillus thuringiensis]|uniref:Crystaline entomocidal protoxin n=1 Tax=Bacillus thuringiensis TaxID=1428 RepID=A0A9W3X2Q3_BACTU|nr:insecticidal delta-endotoxin Cry8Ea1 family protein [Bacillus thuringiensis]ANS50148.1 pesticidal crystal protein Cry13Ab1 [Bacillus thuringiensis]MBH0337219.1 hypothetical protein [Bacillus thuringiensis]
MTCQLQAQPLIPYNVLAGVPTSNTGSPIGNAGNQFDQFEQTVKELKEAWEAFQKNGSFSLAALEKGFDAAIGGGSFDYLGLVQAGLGLVGTLGAAIPGVSVAVPLISMLVGVFWPKGTNNQENLITVIDKEVQRILDEKLSDQLIKKLNADLNAFTDLVTRLEEVIIDATFENHKPVLQVSKSNYMKVDSAYFSTGGILTLGMSDFLTDTYSKLTFPLYVLGATMKLSAYHSYIQFGNTWLNKVYDLSSDEGKTMSQALARAKQHMRQDIAFYTSQALNMFTGNLPSLSSNKYAINDYNVYTRAMVLNGLDIVATWPTLYPDDYSSQIKLEKTRVIFSDMVGQSESRDGSVTIKNIFDNTDSHQHGSIGLNSISYFPDELQKAQLRMYDYNHKPYCTDCFCWPYGVILNYNKNTFRYGDNDPGLSGDVQLPAPMSVVNAQTQTAQYTDGENIWTDTGRSWLCTLRGYCTTNCFPGRGCYNNSTGYGESCNQSLPGQKIHALYPFTQTNVLGQSGKLGLLASHIPYDLSPNNTIGDKDTDSTNIVAKGIPVEKGYASSGQKVEIIREWINGANVVQLSPGQSWGMDFTNSTGGQYMVRCRYASTNDTPIFFNLVYDGGSNPIYNQMTFPATKETPAHDSVDNKILGIKGINGNYSLMNVKDSVELPSGKFHVFFTNNGSSAIYLDRLEFVPLGKPSPGVLYSGSYDLMGSQYASVLFNDQNASYTTVSINGVSDAHSTSGSITLFNNETLVKGFDVPGSGQSYQYSNVTVPPYNRVNMTKGTYAELSGSVTIKGN